MQGYQTGFPFWGVEFAVGRNDGFLVVAVLGAPVGPAEGDLLARVDGAAAGALDGDLVAVDSDAGLEDLSSLAFVEGEIVFTDLVVGTTEGCLWLSPTVGIVGCAVLVLVGARVLLT